MKRPHALPRRTGRAACAFRGRSRSCACALTGLIAACALLACKPGGRVTTPESALSTRTEVAGCTTRADGAAGDGACGVAASPTIAALAARCPAPRGPGITLAGLLTEMVDLEHLTRAPEVPYVSRLVSSHNRASDDAEPGSKAWFANQDFIALTDGAPVTLLDVQGPGVLTRLWSASPAGVLRVYVDGADTPVIEAELASLLSGAVAPFTEPYAFVAAGGHNLYFPIPFARACRVTLTGSADVVFYQLSYRQYREGSELQSFGERALADAECERTEVAARLRTLRPHTAAEGGARHAFELAAAPPGRAFFTLTAEPGGSAIRQVRARPRRVDAAALRGTVLSIAFDGVETVRAPLGDFFALGPGAVEIASVPVGASGGVLTARWPMPFAKQARLAIESADAGAGPVAFELVTGPAPFTGQSLYFHAQWRAPQTFPSKPSRDLELAALAGRGFYVGNVLNVVNRNDAWWGEGDEKIYVDGERFPSHFGTGTEDYYGYAWCSNARFSTAYVGQPASTARRSFGAASLYRFHVLDPIPFQRALRFDLEVRHWGDPVAVTYDALGFWYAQPAAFAPGSARSRELFRVPELGVAIPGDVPEGPYACGP